MMDERDLAQLLRATRRPPRPESQTRAISAMLMSAQPTSRPGVSDSAGPAPARLAPRLSRWLPLAATILIFAIVLAAIVATSRQRTPAGRGQVGSPSYPYSSVIPELPSWEIIQTALGAEVVSEQYQKGEIIAQSNITPPLPINERRNCQYYLGVSFARSLTLEQYEDLRKKGYLLYNDLARQQQDILSQVVALYPDRTYLSQLKGSYIEFIPNATLTKTPRMIMGITVPNGSGMVIGEFRLPEEDRAAE